MSAKESRLAARIAQLNLPGLDDELGALTTGSMVDLSAHEASQVTLVFIDPGHVIVNKVRVGGRMRYGGLPFTVASIKYADRRTTIIAREAGWQALKARTGSQAWKGRSASQVVIAEVAAVNKANDLHVKTVVQATKARKSIARTTSKVKAEIAKADSLQLLSRLAGEEDMWFGCVNQTIFFAKPAYLLARAGRAVGWADTYLAGEPELYLTADDPEVKARLTLKVLGEAITAITPFTPIQVSGGPTKANRRYLIEQVTVPLDSGQPATVQAIAPRKE